MGAVAADAQNGTKSPTATKAQKETDKLVKELGLDAKQKEKVHAANLEFERELEKLDKQKLTKEEKQNKKQLLRQRQLEHLKNVLKPEQYEKVAARLGGNAGQKPAPGKKSKGNKPTPKKG